MIIRWFNVCIYLYVSIQRARLVVLKYHYYWYYLLILTYDVVRFTSLLHFTYTVFAVSIIKHQ